MMGAMVVVAMHAVHKGRRYRNASAPRLSLPFRTCSYTSSLSNRILIMRECASEHKTGYQGLSTLSCVYGACLWSVSEHMHSSAFLGVPPLRIFSNLDEWVFHLAVM